MPSKDPDPATAAYTEQVNDIVVSRPRDSDWMPAHPMELRIVRHRMPQSVDELEPAEREQLAAISYPESLETVLSPEYMVEDSPLEVEVAVVVDETGAVRYRLYGMNYGIIYVMPPTGLDAVAFAAQHDLEHWNQEQRAVFWALDRAYLRKDHHFAQGPLFCWWKQTCWDEIAATPGPHQSEQYIREHFAKAAEALAATPR